MEKYDKVISGMTKNYIKRTFQNLVIRFTFQGNRYRKIKDNDMTMQIPDTVIYNDAIYETGGYCADLFEPYLEKHHIELFADCSAIWRGYIATWKIENDMLYLVEIYANVTGAQSQGRIKCSENTIYRLLSDEAVGMDYFFPNQSKVFADWYFGNLPVHNENTVKGESKYIIFKVDKGHIIEQEQVTEQEYYNHNTYK